MKGKTKIVFGSYSLGSGAILKNPDALYNSLDDPAVIEDYQISMTRDMNKSGIALEKIKNFDVMDVGTGRQSIVFSSKFGAKSVSHHDASPENVERVKQYIAARPDSRMTTTCVDLVEDKLSKEKFDLVYLNGIVQHFSNVEKGLLNCMQAAKVGGLLWLYFYRSGSFVYFVNQMVRDLIKDTANIDEYYQSAMMLYGDTAKPNTYVSGIMEDMFYPYIHLYTAQTYFDFVNFCGFEVISSSKLDPFGRAVDHEYNYHSVVLTCRKLKSTPETLPDDFKARLTPQQAVNELVLEYEDPDIAKTVGVYNEIKKKIAERNAGGKAVMALAFKLYHFMRSSNDNKHVKHEKLQQILRNFNEILA